MPKQIATLFCCMLLCGCADLNLRRYEKELNDELRTDSGTLVVFRTLGFSTFEPEVYINGAPKCVLEDKTYCILNLSAGTYSVWIKGYVQGKGEQKIGTNIKLAANTHSFAHIGASGYAVPTPFVSFVGGTLRVGASSKEDFLNVRDLLERVPPK